MRSRAMGTWIAVLLLVGGGAVAVRAQDAGHEVSVSTQTGPSSSAQLEPDPSDLTVATDVPADPSTTTSATGPTSTTTGRSGSTRTTATTAPPARGGKLVASPAQVSEPGVYVVRRDGTGLRRVSTTCGSADTRQWLDDSTLLVLHDGASTPVRLHLDGSSQAFPLLTVTGPTGSTVALRGLGSLSPDRRQMVMSFQGLADGVAIVDLTTGQATPVMWGDNPTPTWSPTGEILLVGPDKAVLQGPAGVVRTMTPAPVGFLPPFLSWSPDGRQIVGPPSMVDMNHWVVVDPRTGTSRAVPTVGSGGRNDVEWAGPSRMVIADPGQDHRIAASLHVYDLATGQVRALVAGGWGPAVPADGQVIAFVQRPDETKLDLLSIDGTGRSTLVQTAPGLFAIPGSWSPSGQLLQLDVCRDGRAASSLPVT